MQHHHDTNPSARQVTLPSGRKIEIVYLDETPAPVAPDPQPTPGEMADAEAAVDLTVCGLCDCQFVQPVDWDEAGPRHWKLELRCPNCESHGTVVVGDEVVDHYDLVLERGSAELARSLHELVESGIDDEVLRFSTALEQDLILPEDF
jgi:hypothetical protein